LEKHRFNPRAEYGQRIFVSSGVLEELEDYKRRLRSPEIDFPRIRESAERVVSKKYHSVIRYSYVICRRVYAEPSEYYLAAQWYYCPVNKIRNNLASKAEEIFGKKGN
jgi:hypothetical protein